MTHPSITHREQVDSLLDLAELMGISFMVQGRKLLMHNLYGVSDEFRQQVKIFRRLIIQEYRGAKHEHSRRLPRVPQANRNLDQQ